MRRRGRRERLPGDGSANGLITVLDSRVRDGPPAAAIPVVKAAMGRTADSVGQAGGRLQGMPGSGRTGGGFVNWDVR